MQQTILRNKLLDELTAGLNESPIVTLLGARQVGKTTLARQFQEKTGQATVFDLESQTGMTALEKTPELTLRECRGLVIIDEIQRMPALFRILRPICDDPSLKAAFLLLGSASPDLIRGVSESLAGRAQFLPIPGFSIQEVGPDQQDRLWLRGTFPRAFLAASEAAAFRWLASFRQTLLERDIPSLGLRIPQAALGRFWALLAHYHGQIWNAAELGRAMDASPATANRYRDIFAGTYMLRVLYPWFENVGKRQVKAPKIYLRDPGLLHQLLGISTMRDLREHPRYGASWEGFALEQTLALCGDADSWFWSTQRGAELDLLLFRNGRRWGMEFKCTDAPTTTKSMRIALEDLGLAHLWVVYPGRAAYPMAERISALPLRDLPTVSFSSLLPSPQ
jgi:predicted AAA+ superfamily ATPase